uniref:Nucleoporin Nup43 n=1 Tax=Acrobeloides nanus TaxID=290746 RepID=A0A914C7A8_9BILA
MQLLQTTKADGSDSSRRKFAGSKISKVRWTNDTDENVDTFLTGSWNCPENTIVLWQIRREIPVDEDNLLNSAVFVKKVALPVHGDVNDLCVIPNKKAAAALGNGEVVLLDISSKSHLTELNSYKATEKGHAATTVCVLDDIMFVGTEAGAIMRVSLTNFFKPGFLAKELTTVRCMKSCGPAQFVTGHDTSQLHLWDLRTIDPALILNGTGTAYPTSIRAASSFNDAITALASHPAEPNLLAYGTQSGSVGFFDIRRPESQMPNMLTVATDPINELKFHPIYANNCFSATQNALIHWDASALGKYTTRVLTNSMMETDNLEGFRENPWLMANVYSSIQLTEMLEDDLKFISTFDVSPRAIIVGSDSSTLALIENTKFM